MALPRSAKPRNVTLLAVQSNDEDLVTPYSAMPMAAAASYKPEVTAVMVLESDAEPTKAILLPVVFRLEEAAEDMATPMAAAALYMVTVALIVLALDAEPTNVMLLPLLFTSAGPGDEKAKPIAAAALW